MAPVSEDVKLLGTWASPFAIRVRIALNVKGVEYEYEEEDLRSKSEILLKSNPVYKKIPVLIHGDLSISESLVILEYIDEAWPSGPQILPSHPYLRASARFWAFYVDQKMYPLIREMILSDGEEDEKKIDEVSEALNLLENAFTSTSKGQKFFGGEKIGFLDIVFGSLIFWFKVMDKTRGVNMINENETPNLFKWHHHFTSDSAVKGLLPETDKLIEFTKYLKAKFKAPAMN